MFNTPDFLKTKDFQTITGKSERQCQRDIKDIKKKLNKLGRKKLVTLDEAAHYYGITKDFIVQKLIVKPTQN